MLAVEDFIKHSNVTKHFPVKARLHRRFLSRNSMLHEVSWDIAAMKSPRVFTRVN